MKICKDCKQEKAESDFYVANRKTNQLRAECKKCCSLRHKTHAFDKENHRKYLKEYIQRPKEKQRRQEYSKKYYSDSENKEQARLALIQWRKDNSERHKELHAKYRKKNALNPSYRLNRNIRSRMRHSIKNNKVGHKWEAVVGYTLNELKQHIEGKFTEGMNWNNYGEWHIDHIKPCCSFDIKDTKSPDFKLCWALTNLQPLWAMNNYKKGKKHLEGQFVQFEG